MISCIRRIMNDLPNIRIAINITLSRAQQPPFIQQNEIANYIEILHETVATRSSPGIFQNARRILTVP